MTIKATDLFKPASKEEVAKRQEQYSTILMSEAIEAVKKTKLPDGTWRIHENLDLSWFGVKTLKNLNVSIIDKSCSCRNNELGNLEGSPTIIKGEFWCSYNNLTSLKGAPRVIKENFFCSYNKLTSLEGAPKKVGGYFFCHHNTKQFTEEEVRAVCDVKGKIYTKFTLY